MQQVQPKACTASHLQNGFCLDLTDKIKQCIPALPMLGGRVALIVVI